eukprot:TCONS_00073222-protein
MDSNSRPQYAAYPSSTLLLTKDNFNNANTAATAVGANPVASTQKVYTVSNYNNSTSAAQPLHQQRSPPIPPQNYNIQYQPQTATYHQSHQPYIQHQQQPQIRGGHLVDNRKASSLPPIREEYIDRYPQSQSPQQYLQQQQQQQKPIVQQTFHYQQRHSPQSPQPYQNNFDHQRIQSPRHHATSPGPVLANHPQQPIQQVVMNSRGYTTVPQNIPEPSIVQPGANNMAQQQQLQQQSPHLNPSSSPYSTSPAQSRGSYPNSPATGNLQYIQQTKNDANLVQQANDVLALLDEKVPGGDPSQPIYQQQLSQGGQLPPGYPTQGDYSQSPPNLLYYPYHKDFLNSSTENSNTTYSVKLASGVVHQYPTPDYNAGSPQQQSQQPQVQIPLPDYPTSNGYIETSKQNNANLQQNPAYNPPQTQQPVVNNNQIYQQQQQQPQNTQTVAGQQLPRYDEVQQQGMDRYLNPTSPNQYNQPQQQQTPQGNKQPSLPTSPQTHGAIYNTGNIPVSDYNSYRTNNLDSPQGSPMPAPNNQVSPNAFKPPTGTPPLQRKTQPARQISNELYANIGSPSNQLLLGDMSLNSPRPRSETVDMEAPNLPSRSSNTASDQQPSIPTTTVYYEMPPPSMPPPSIPPPTIRSSTSTSQATIQANASPQMSAERRLRSGTVEMVDAGTRPGSTPQMSTAASQRYLPTAQLSMPQRSRAGTVEMADGTTPAGLSLPERRIRSGTVEMTEVGGGQQPQLLIEQGANQPSQTNYQTYHVPNSQQLQQIDTTKQVNNGQKGSIQQQQQATVKASPPPYSTQSTATLQSQVSSPQSPVYATVSTPNVSTQQAAPSTSIPPQSHATSNKQLPPNQQYVTPNKATYPQQQQQQQQHTTPLQHQPLPYNQQQGPPASHTTSNQQQQQQQPHTNGTTVTDDRGYTQQISQDGRGTPVMYYKQDGRSSLPPSNTAQPQQSPNLSSSGMPSPASQLSVENLKLSPQLQKNGTTTVQQQQQQQQPKKDYDPNQQQQQPNLYATDQEQKIMQQQYLQRVRQAQLQEQLRQLQSEYENSLQVEHDIAFEFLREQELKDDTYRQPGNTSATSNTPAQQNTQKIPQQPNNNYNQQHPSSTPPLQHSNYRQQPQNAHQQYIPPNAQQQQQSPRNYPPPHPSQYQQNIPPQMVGNHPSHHQQHRMQQQQQYKGEVPVFPVTGIPINQPMYPSQRMPYQQQMMNQKGSQPIVIMPGGGGISNPGQFLPTSGGPHLTGHHPVSQRSKPPQSSGGSSSGIKQQTPFQKLRKIAEEISSFVDDVVKFTGKKGDHEYKYLEEMLSQQVLLLDKVAASGSDELRNARKALVKEVQELLEILERRATSKN